MGLIFGVLGCMVLASAVPGRAAPSSRPSHPTTAASPHKPRPATRPQRKTAREPHKKKNAAAQRQSSLWNEMRSTQWWATVQHWFMECGEGRWNEAKAFMKKHSPRRWEAYESLEPDSEFQRNVRRYILARYNSLAPLQKHDPALYKMQLRELKLEDDIFGVASQRHGRRDAQARDDKLATLAGALVDTQLKIREMRIVRLEKAIATAKKRLEKDQKRRDQLVKNEIRRVEQHAEPPRHQGRPHRASPTTRSASTRPAK